ncbi:MAG TPA: DMT family transporter [Candidatus Deferrimicrobiaceae bacterium]|nr:DMT family transporter [Candidatus Deferrimicrobiaceae bacterium]
MTFLWATSWVLIKIGLDDLDLRPVSFAGLRYALAAVLLLPFGWRAVRAARRGGAGIDRPLLGRILALGVTLYAVAQGTQFAALAVLPAASVGLVLATIPVWIGAVAWLRGGERASPTQVLGIGLLVAGAALYFGQVDLGAAGWFGLASAALCAASSTAGQHLARDLNRDAQGRLGGAIGLTSVSMGIGSLALLAAGIALEGWPTLDERGWAIVAWLAAVNTAFAFTLYNRALRVLTAVESSTIINLLLVMVAIMAWVFLGEALDIRQVIGLAIVTVGVLFVQLAPLLRGRWRTRRA